MKKEILAAKNRINPYVYETPLIFSEALSRITNAKVYLKCENLQPTGSFKIRGAFNKLLSLSSPARKQGVVTASSGNHGAAVAYGLKKLNIPGIIFVPENTSKVKIENIRNYDATLNFYARDCMQTEMHALNYAKENKMNYISPYDDLEVIAGQGSAAVEIIAQLDDIDTIFVPIGGGGLIAGIASYVKSISPKTQIIGCMPENSPVMYESIKAGKIVEMPTLPTLSDATAGGIIPEAVTFDLCQQYVDDYILTSEQEIAEAIISLLKNQRLLAEGASGVALGAFLKNAEKFCDKTVVIVLSGGNINIESLKKLLN